MTLPRSLHARLLLLIGVIVGIALLTLALLSRVGVQREYLELRSHDRRQSLEQAAAALDAQLRAGGLAAASDSARARAAAMTDSDLLIAGADGRVLAASSRSWRSAVVTLGANGEVGIAVTHETGVNAMRARLRMRGAPDLALHGPDGATLAHLYAVPAEHARGGDGRVLRRTAPFLVRIDRWLFGVVFAVAILTALLAGTLSRRVTRPIEALTAAARRMGAGDLTQRVPVSSSDEIGELAEAFNAMADAVARNEAARRGLVSDVAHELRTPLTHLRGRIEAMQDGLLAADDATLQSLHDETLLLARLVDDLQDLALAEAGRLPLHREAVALAPAIDAAVAAVSATARERGVTLRTDVAASTPAADVDPARLAQVLRNLLTNALTHCREGGRVTVSAAAAGESVAIVVADDGVGIAAEHLPHVFDRFYRADPARSRASGNAGLGLAIVRQLAQAHGGSVAAQSRPGEGARFTVTLPAARPS